jgi:hypothetical protein
MNATQNNSEGFTLSEGGPFNEALMKMGLHKKQGKLALISLCITWLPLVIITAIKGTLYSGTELPFLKDAAMQARLLVALPMLIMIKLAIDSKVTEVAKSLADNLMSSEERQAILSTAFQRAKNLTNSAYTEIILLLIVIVITISFVKSGVYSGLDNATTSWMVQEATGKQALSIAGYWAVCISIPLFQFFLLRWIWRYFVWVLLLFRLSKARLNLLATHADRAGGLGNIVLAQRNFNMIFVAASTFISGQFITELNRNPDAFITIRNEIIGYIAICIILSISPLVFFAGKLVKTKQQGLLHLSNLAADLSRKFEKEWVNDLPIEKRIEDRQVDPSMLFDYSGLYDSLQQLRTIPVTLRDVIGMAAMLFVPFIPILFIHFSVAELLKKIVGMLA